MDGAPEHSIHSLLLPLEESPAWLSGAGSFTSWSWAVGTAAWEAAAVAQMQSPHLGNQSLRLSGGAGLKAVVSVRATAGQGGEARPVTGRQVCSVRVCLLGLFSLPDINC